MSFEERLKIHNEIERENREKLKEWKEGEEVVCNAEQDAG